MSDYFRYEIKFQLNEGKYAAIINWLYIMSKFTRKYPNRMVNSLYFDDLNFNSVRDNLSGVLERKKFRLRWYGRDLSNAKSLIYETKIRNGRLGGKKLLNLDKIKSSLHGANISKITDVLNRYRFKSNYEISKEYLLPSLFVNYEREYFQDNTDIRITIDSKINFSIPSPEKSLNELRKTAFSQRVLEVKFNQASKDLAQSYIARFKLTPVRNSKYLTGLAMFKLVNYL